MTKNKIQKIKNIKRIYERECLQHIQQFYSTNFILFYSQNKAFSLNINKKYNSNFIIHFCKFDVLQRIDDHIRLPIAIKLTKIIKTIKSKNLNIQFRKN